MLTPDAELPVPTILLRCRPKLEAASQFIVLNQKISQLSREILQRRGAEGELRELNQTLEVRAEERAREDRECCISAPRDGERIRRDGERDNRLRDFYT